MNPEDKIDLSSVNKQPKQKKQLKLPGFLKRKNTAGPGRDAEGKFTSGSGGLINTKNFNWKRAVPLMLVVALVGGFLVYRSFAGTYKACANAANGYSYALDCVTESDEASVIRLYYGIFNRAPDKSGLQYWTDKLTRTDKYHKDLAEIARQFMGSSEFSRKYGTLTNEQFVKAMYPQVFGREPDPSGLTYWTNKLNRGSISRHSMMANFTQSSEMKRNFAYTVARDLGVADRLEGKELSSGETECYGTISTNADGSKWCTVEIKKYAVQDSYKNYWVSVGNIPFSPGAIAAGAEAKTQVKLVNAGSASLECSGVGPTPYSGSITSNQAKKNEANSFGGGYGGCGTLNSSEETNYFSVGNLVDNTTGLLLRMYVSSGSSVGDQLASLPANAAVSFKMNGIKFKESLFGSEVSNPLSQSNVQTETVGTEKVNIKGSNYTLTKVVPYVSTANGSEWTQESAAKYAGKTRFTLSASTKINIWESDSYTAKFRVTVYNADTNKIVPASEYTVSTPRLGSDTSQGYKMVQLSPSNGVYTMTSDVASQDDIVVETKTTFPTRYRYQIDILSPSNYKLFRSYVTATNL